MIIVPYSNEIGGGGPGGYNVTVSVGYHVVHITNDTILKNGLSYYGYSYAVQVAQYAKAVYKARYGTTLAISDNSMAIEILGHVYPDKMASILPTSLKNEVRSHTSIIDSGQSDVDTNRKYWDTISYGYSMYQIYQILK